MDKKNTTNTNVHRENHNKKKLEELLFCMSFFFSACLFDVLRFRFVFKLILFFFFSKEIQHHDAVTQDDDEQPLGDKLDALRDDLEEKLNIENDVKSSTNE